MSHSLVWFMQIYCVLLFFFALLHHWRFQTLYFLKTHYSFIFELLFTFVFDSFLVFWQGHNISRTKVKNETATKSKSQIFNTISIVFPIVWAFTIDKRNTWKKIKFVSHLSIQISSNKIEFDDDLSRIT